MKMYEEYLKHEGYELIEIPDVGFCTYTMVVPECYIRDIYVRPDFRQHGVCFKMADIVTKVAKSKGCTVLIGSVRSDYKDASISRKVLLGYGMKFGKSDGSTELFFKEI